MNSKGRGDFLNAREELLKLMILWLPFKAILKSKINKCLQRKNIYYCFQCFYAVRFLLQVPLSLSPLVLLLVMICFFFHSLVSLVCDHYLNRAVAYHGSRPIIIQWHRSPWPVLDIMSRLLGDFSGFRLFPKPAGLKKFTYEDYQRLSIDQLCPIIS